MSMAMPTQSTRCLAVYVASLILVACSSNERTTQGGDQNAGAGGSDPGSGGNDGAGTSGSAQGGGSLGTGGAPELVCNVECAPCDAGYELVECGLATCICTSTDDPYRDGHLALSLCSLDEPCPDSIVDRNPGTDYWSNGECLLTALRDRTPGRYRFSSLDRDLGGTAIHHLLLIDGTSQVTVLTTHELTLGLGTTTRTYDPVQRCTLASHEALEACIAIGTELQDDATPGIAPDPACETLEDWVGTCQSNAGSECPGS